MDGHPTHNLRVVESAVKESEATDQEGSRLISAFRRIKNAKLREEVILLAERHADPAQE